MRFKIATLLLIVTSCAIAFALVRLTNDANFALIVLTCTAAAVAIKSTGPLKRFTLAFSVLSFAMLFIHPIPYAITDLVWNSVQSERPVKTLADAVSNRDNEMAIYDVLQAASRIFIAVVVATLFAWSTRQRTGVTMRSTEVAESSS